MKSLQLMLLPVTLLLSFAVLAQADNSQTFKSDKPNQCCSHKKQLNLSSKEKMKMAIMKEQPGSQQAGDLNDQTGYASKENPTISLKEKMKGETMMQPGSNLQPVAITEACCNTNKQHQNLSKKEKMKAATMKQ
jgi:hypothetical protein